MNAPKWLVFSMPLHGGIRGLKAGGSYWKQLFTIKNPVTIRDICSTRHSDQPRHIQWRINILNAVPLIVLRFAIA